MTQTRSFACSPETNLKALFDMLRGRDIIKVVKEGNTITLTLAVEKPSEENIEVEAAKLREELAGFMTEA